MTQMRDGLFTRFEYYDLDRMGDAVARYDELRSASRSPDNAATRASDAVSHLVRHGDIDHLADRFHPDAIVADHARLGQGAGGRRDFVYFMRSWREVWNEGEADHGGPVAIRGDRLALMEYRFGTEGGWSIDRLAVVETDENDLITYLNFYDPDDRQLALAELDERFEQGGRR